VIIISVSGLLSDSGRYNGFEDRRFEDIKNGLEELYEYDIVLEYLEKSRFFDSESSVYVGNETFMGLRLLISEIKEKQEITKKLDILSSNVGSLRTAITTKDNEATSKILDKITKNKYSGISAVITDLNCLKNKIDELESLYLNLLGDSELTLDIKVLLEQDFMKKQKLDEMYTKQKNILISISGIFRNLVRGSVLKGKK
jgi:hypothetical protein